MTSPRIIKTFNILKNTIVTGLKIFITNISFGVNTLLFNRSVKRLYTTIVIWASLGTIGVSNTVVFKIIIAHDPFYQNEIAQYDIIEFEASKYCPEFETIISKPFDDK